MPGKLWTRNELATLRRLAKGGAKAKEIAKSLPERSRMSILKQLDREGFGTTYAKPILRMKPEHLEEFVAFVTKHSSTLHPQEIADQWNAGRGKELETPTVDSDRVRYRQEKAGIRLTQNQIKAMPFAKAKAQEKQETKREKRNEEKRAALVAEKEAQAARLLKKKSSHPTATCSECEKTWPVSSEFFPHTGRTHIEIHTEHCLVCEAFHTDPKRLTGEHRLRFVQFLKEHSKKRHPEELAKMWNTAFAPELGAAPITRTVVEEWQKRNGLKLSSEALAALPYSKALRKQAAKVQSDAVRKRAAEKRAQKRAGAISKRDADLKSGALDAGDLAQCGTCEEMWPDTNKFFVESTFKSRKTGKKKTYRVHYACRFCQNDRTSELYEKKHRPKKIKFPTIPSAETLKQKAEKAEARRLKRETRAKERGPSKRERRKASGACVFCKKHSDELQLVSGREKRGKHCPVCAEKVSKMTDERLLQLDAIMARFSRNGSGKKPGRKASAPRRTPVYRDPDEQTFARDYQDVEKFAGNDEDTFLPPNLRRRGGY